MARNFFGFNARVDQIMDEAVAAMKHAGADPGKAVRTYPPGQPERPPGAHLDPHLDAAPRSDPRRGRSQSSGFAITRTPLSVSRCTRLESSGV